jgi:abortive infection alpha-like protein
MDEREQEELSLIQALPGLARVGVMATWRGTEWTVTTSMRVYMRVLRSTLSGKAPQEILREGGTDLRQWLRRLLEVIEEESPDRGVSSRNGAGAGRDAREPTLQERGAALLRRSADVHDDDGEHPAYERILQELAPDEARILRLMYREGSQAAVDIRTGGPIGLVNSQLVAPGLTMIGREAGVRRDDRVHAYLNNLERLGLIWFSREPLEEQGAYQVLEAQPEVVDVMEEAGRTRTVRRSIHLTPFGQDFCRMCLPLDTAEIDALPRPPEAGEPGGSDSPTRGPATGAPRGLEPQVEGRRLPEQDPRRAPGQGLPRPAPEGARKRE